MLQSSSFKIFMSKQVFILQICVLWYIYVYLLQSVSILVIQPTPQKMSIGVADRGQNVLSVLHVLSVSVCRYILDLPWKDERVHWNRFKGIVGGASVRWGGVHMGFSKHIDTILNWTELNCLSVCMVVSKPSVVLFQMAQTKKNSMPYNWQQHYWFVSKPLFFFHEKSAK